MNDDTRKRITGILDDPGHFDPEWAVPVAQPDSWGILDDTPVMFGFGAIGTVNY